MKPLHTYLRFPALIVFLLFLTACSESENHATKSATIATLDVYKSRTCQCCQQWIHHMEDVGFDTKTHHPSDLNRIKNDYGIAPEFQSCIRQFRATAMCSKAISLRALFSSFWKTLPMTPSALVCLACQQAALVWRWVTGLRLTRYGCLKKTVRLMCLHL